MTLTVTPTIPIPTSITSLLWGQQRLFTFLRGSRLLKAPWTDPEDIVLRRLFCQRSVKSLLCPYPDVPVREFVNPIFCFLVPPSPVTPS